MKKKRIKGTSVPKQVSKQENYKVVLDTGGKEYKAEGASIDESIAKLGLSWEQIKAKGVVRISYQGNSYEHLFYPKQLRRIFANKITRFMWAKRLLLLFSETAAMNGSK